MTLFESSLATTDREQQLVGVPVFAELDSIGDNTNYHLDAAAETGARVYGETWVNLHSVLHDADPTPEATQAASRALDLIAELSAQRAREAVQEALDAQNLVSETEQFLATVPEPEAPHRDQPRPTPPLDTVPQAVPLDQNIAYHHVPLPPLSAEPMHFRRPSSINRLLTRARSAFSRVLRRRSEPGLSAHYLSVDYHDSPSGLLFS